MSEGENAETRGSDRTHLGRIHVLSVELLLLLVLHLLHLLPHPSLVLRHVWMGLLELLALALTLLLLLLLVLLLLLLLEQVVVKHWPVRGGHAICHVRRCGGREGEPECSGGGSEARLAGCG